MRKACVLRARTVKIRVPRRLINFVHWFRVTLNPRYADEMYEMRIETDLPLKEIEHRMSRWGCEVNHPNQYRYPNQISSGHLYLKDGRQLHIRVFAESKKYILKAHVEWDGVRHPIRHTFYVNLDYEKGYRMLKSLWERGVTGDVEEAKNKHG